MLPGVLRALRDFDLKIPDDISVIAGADTDLAALFDPPVTAISWNERDQGRFAVELLLDRIAQPDAPVNRVDLPTELIIRNSCSVAR
jgi:LacI family transcriptional regulator